MPDLVINLAELVGYIDLVEEIEPYSADTVRIGRVKRLLQQQLVGRSVVVVRDAQPELESAFAELTVMEREVREYIEARLGPTWRNEVFAGEDHFT